MCWVFAQQVTFMQVHSPFNKAMWSTDCSCMVVTCLSHAHVHYLDTSLDTVHWLLPVFWDHRGQSVEGLLHLPPSFSQERSKGNIHMMNHPWCATMILNLLPPVLLITSAQPMQVTMPRAANECFFSIAWYYGDSDFLARLYLLWALQPRLIVRNIMMTK